MSRGGVQFLTLAVLVLATGCASKRTSYRVIPAKPDYLIRSPDSKSTPFPDVLGHYTDVGFGWVRLRPFMELRVENAYYREGAPKRGLANFLGTEVVRYRVNPNGTLRQLAVETSLAQRPADQPPVQELLAGSQARFRRHKFFFQVILNRNTGAQTAILLSAGSIQQLESLSKALLLAPESACGEPSGHCTVFPQACTVSVEMQIVVNGVPRSTPWGSTVANIAAHPAHVSLLRAHGRRLVPVDIDVADPLALRLPLLPGDRLTWR